MWGQMNGRSLRWAVWTCVFNALFCFRSVSSTHGKASGFYLKRSDMKRKEKKAGKHTNRFKRLFTPWILTMEILADHTDAPPPFPLHRLCARLPSQPLILHLPLLFLPVLLRPKPIFLQPVLQPPPLPPSLLTFLHRPIIPTLKPQQPLVRFSFLMHPEVRLQVLS